MPDFGKYVNRLPPDTKPELARALADVFRDLATDDAPAQRKLSNYKDIKADYGAAGDGTTDDLAKFNQAITDLKSANGGVLFIPSGVYYLSSAWTLTNAHGITVMGGGVKYEPNATLGATHARLKFDTAGGGISVVDSRGCNFRNIYVDGSATVTNGITLDRLKFSTWENVFTDNIATCGWLLTETSGTTDESNSWNTFINCGTSSAGTGLELNGTVDSGNWHNTFINWVIAHGSGGPGIDLYYCDNNTFIQTFIFRDAGTAAGVRFRNSSTPPNSIYFYHLQSGGGGLVIDAGVDNPGAVFGYDMSNGQPYPTIPNDVRFSITADGLNAGGWQSNRHIITRGVSDWRSDTNDGWSIRDDGGYGIRLWDIDNGAAWKALVNQSDRYGEMRYSFDGSADVESFKWNAFGIKFATGKTADFADTQTTVGAAGAASALPANPTGYIVVKIGGTDYVVPYYAKT